MASVAAALTARRGQQEDVNAIGRVFGEGTSHAQGFVVRVRWSTAISLGAIVTPLPSPRTALRVGYCVARKKIGYMRGNAVSDLGAVSH